MSNVVKFRGTQGRLAGAATTKQGSLDGIASPARLADLAVPLSDMVEQMERILEAQTRILSVVNAGPAGNAAEALVSEGKASIEFIKCELEKAKFS